MPMKAMVLDVPGLPLRLKELPDVIPGDGQLRMFTGYTRTELYSVRESTPILIDVKRYIQIRSDTELQCRGDRRPKSFGSYHEFANA
jgi:hypothetical protein